MRKLMASISIAATACCFVASANSAMAASLQVAPVLLEVPAPGATATLRVRNTGSEPLNAQIRIFRWKLVNGKDQLIPTKDVVASPPFVRLKPGRHNVVRVVRIAKTPRGPEENYRLLVDELPGARQRSGVAVNLLLRHSIPVFFSHQSRQPHAIEWRVSTTKRGLRVVARNNGDKRLRVSELKIVNGSGKTLASRKGLLGYALGRSTVVWTIPARRGGIRPGSRVRIVAKGDNGPIRTKATVRAGS